MAICRVTFSVRCVEKRISKFIGSSLICSLIYQTQLFEWLPMIFSQSYSETNISINLQKVSLS